MDTKLQLRTYRRWDGLTADAVALLTSAREDPFAIPLLVSPSTAHARAVGQAVADEVGVAAGLLGCRGKRPVHCAVSCHSPSLTWIRRSIRGVARH